MKEKRKFRIAVDTGNSQKAIRDRCSGFMRYVMERSLPWDIRFFAQWDAQDRQSWDSLILKWKPDGICLNSLYDISDGRLKHIPNIVMFESHSKNASMKFPRRTIFVGIDNRQIAAESFQLLVKRGLNHFAYIHAPAINAEAYHSQVRAEAFVRCPRTQASIVLNLNGRKARLQTGQRRWLPLRRNFPLCRVRVA